ncbi:cAMP-dependent protein kinase inhibitor gamma isoform X2 [Morone saxatilis]|uniref:cAMP-dependent protein kinase inhibitor gamma isoform X2 n=1 Tax=Morone saxatilis TaxID=34816 RepID=UPI0015E2451D|nr:cAMP-dependent protein kinase inhibitor gamma isoform X2 [Morone saxatilis]
MVKALLLSLPILIRALSSRPLLFSFFFFFEILAACNESAGHGQMMDVETSYSDFINCDRTGRRNAVPDIAGEGEVAASTSELTKDMAEMDLKAAGAPGASPAPEAEGSTSQDAQGSGGPS